MAEPLITTPVVAHFGRKVHAIGPRRVGLGAAARHIGRFAADGTARLQGIQAGCCEKPSPWLHERLAVLLVWLLLAGMSCRVAAETSPVGPAVMSSPAFAVTLALPTQKLTATAPGILQPFRVGQIALHGRGGFFADFQVVVSAQAKAVEVHSVTLQAATAGPLVSSSVYFENYVFVPRPSGNRRLDRVWWPDALIPAGLVPKRTIAPFHSEVLWVSVKVPTGVGLRRLQLVVTCADGQLTREITLETTPGAIPRRQFRANVAVYYDLLRDWYRHHTQCNFSEQQWAVEKRRYYDFLLDYGFNAYELPVAWGTREAAEYLRDDRVHSVRVPPVANGDFAACLTQLREPHTLAKAYSYTFDEPSPDIYPAIRSMAKVLRQRGLPQVVTMHPNAALQGAVDIWCPDVGDWFGIGHVDLAALARERQLGRQTWCYEMAPTRFPYPSWLLDDDGTQMERWKDLVLRDGYTGCVYSMAHGWGPDPLHDLTSFAGTSGDGTLLYPAELVGGMGPMPSIRLMLLREALQEISVSWEESQAPTARPALASPSLPPLEMLPNLDALTLKLTRWGTHQTVNPTLVTLRRAGRFLEASSDAQQMQDAESVALELAPINLERDPERLTFRVDERGQFSVIRATREGRFAMQCAQAGATVSVDRAHWSARIRVPWQQLGWRGPLRVNLRRRTADALSGVAVVLTSSGDDPAHWPVWGQASAAVAAKPAR